MILRRLAAFGFDAQDLAQCDKCAHVDTGFGHDVHAATFDDIEHPTRRLEAARVLGRAVLRGTPVGRGGAWTGRRPNVDKLAAPRMPAVGKHLRLERSGGIVGFA